MTTLKKLAVLGLILLLLPAFGSGQRMFAPGIDPWPRWQAHDPTSTQTVDHSAWDAWLARYLVPGADGVVRVRYGSVSPEDRTALTAYIATLSATPVDDLARPEQMAFWLNLYNALTVAVVLEHYPVASIRDIDISPGFLADGPWDKDLVTVQAERLTLNDIEHRILRPIWRDPRIHYGVNCASIGCPNLKATAWRSETLERDLDTAAHAYVNDPRGVLVRNGQITVSRIYDWFIEDFGRTEDGVLSHLKRHATDETAAALARIDDLTDTAYDWSLNDAQ